MLNLGKRRVRFSHLKNTFVKILEFGVSQLLYISCKPTSLVRDLEALHAYGYQIQRCRCVDMFPWTANIETVVKLVKKT